MITRLHLRGAHQVSDSARLVRQVVSLHAVRPPGKLNQRWLKTANLWRAD
jgi:hypothetical protein